MSSAAALLGLGPRHFGRAPRRSAFVLRRVVKTIAPLSCACCAVLSALGAVDPKSSRLDGGVLVNPLLQNTFTQDHSSETGVPGPQDSAGVLKRPGEVEAPRASGFLILFRTTYHNHLCPLIVLGRWWFVVLVSSSGYRSTI